MKYKVFEEMSIEELMRLKDEFGLEFTVESGHIVDIKRVGTK